jgi:hypothetical protein
MLGRIAIMSIGIAGGLTLATSANAQSLKHNSDAWPQMKAGNKVCFVKHAHYGESPSWANKRGAKAYAIREWERFTTWEYGSKWGRYNIARVRWMKCAEKGSRWVCKTEAVPCHRAKQLRDQYKTGTERSAL